MHSGWPRTLIDALGRNVTIPEPPRRVASLSPAISEILCVVGGLDRLVAADKYSLSTPCVKRFIEEHHLNVTNLGGYWWSSLSIEKLVAVHPDLVLADAGAQAKLLPQFERLGLRVLYLHGGAAKGITQVYQDILEVGYALGLEAKAAKWVSEMRRNITLVAEKLRGVKPRPVLVILWWSPQGVWVPGGDTFLADMVREAGGVPVTGKYSGWQQLSLEQIAALASKEKNLLILYTGMAGASREQVLKTLKQMASTSVVKSLLANGAVLCGLYGPAPNLVLRPGPFLAEGVQLLAKLIHPDRMGGLPHYAVCLNASG